MSSSAPSMPSSPSTLTYKAELMADYTALVAHPHSSDVSGVLDEDLQPMVFSIGKHGLDSSEKDAHSGKLVVTRAGGQGQRYRVIPGPDVVGTVTHLAAGQDADGLVYLAFASKAADGSTAVHVCAAHKPKDWDHAGQVELLQPPTSAASHEVVEAIYVPDVSVPNVGGSDYPLLAVLTRTKTQQESENAGVLQLKRIVVDKVAKSWTYDFGPLPRPSAFVGKIHDFTVGAISTDFIALNILYEDCSGNLMLDANIVSRNAADDVPTVTRLQPPPGARSLATIANNDSHDLIVGGDGLYHFTAASLTTSQPMPSGRQISMADDRHLVGVESLHLAQSGNTAVVWFRNGRGVLGTAKISTDEGQVLLMASSSKPLTSVAISSITPMFNHETQTHHLLYLDDSGQHYLVSQSPSTSIIEERPWYVEGDGVSDVTQTNSFTMQVQLLDDKKQPTPFAKVLLAVQDNQMMMVNGKHYNVRVQGAEVQCDSTGKLHIDFPTPDAGASSVITVYKKVDKDQRVVVGLVDPARSLKQKLAGINSGASLRDAPLQSGGMLGQNNPRTAEEWDAVARNIQRLHAHLANLPEDGSPSQPSGSIEPLGFLDDISAAWHWVEHKIEDAVVHIAEDIRHFVVTIAGEVFHFVLDCAKKVVKAIAYILAKIEIAIDTIIDWAGLLLEWAHVSKNIKAVRMLTEAFLGQMPTWSGEAIGSVKSSIDHGVRAFKDVLKASQDRNTTVGHLLQSSLSGVSFDLHKTVPGEATTASKAHGSLGTSWTSSILSRSTAMVKGSDSANSTNARFLSMTREKTIAVETMVVVRRARHSKIMRHCTSFAYHHDDEIAGNGVISPHIVEGEDIEARLIDFFKNAVLPFATKMQKNLDGFVDDIKQIWSAGGLQNDDSGAQRFVESIIAFLDLIIEDAAEVFKLFLDLVQLLIKSAFSTIHTPIEIPLLSALYRVVFRADPPSALDIGVFLAAIPLTIGLIVIREISGQDYEMPDLTSFASGLPSLHFPDLSESNYIDSLRDWLVAPYGTLVKSNLTPEQNHKILNLARRDPTSEGNLVPLFDKTTDWQEYGKAGIGHSLATLPEVAFNIVLAFKKAKEIAPVFDWVNLGAEFIGSALSFPNLLSMDPMNASIIEITVWVLRVCEIGFDMLFTIAGAKSDEMGASLYPLCKSCVNIVMTFVQCLLEVAAVSIRLKDLDDNPNSENNHEEKVASSLAMVEAISAGIASTAANIADILFTSAPADPAFVIPAAVAGGVGVIEFSSDLARAVYEYKRIYRAVPFR